MVLSTRIAFTWLNPTLPMDFMKADSREYVDLAERALEGNFDFSVGRFIRSPLYPLFLSVNMILFQNEWMLFAIAWQIIFATLTGLVLCSISYKLFSSKPVMLITGALYAIYPPTLYYVYSISTETLYLLFHVTSFYFLLRLFKEQKLKFALGYGISLSLAFLTRSEIALFAPFLILLLVYHFHESPSFLAKSAILIAATLFLISLPWGLTNLSIHDSYIASSNGGKYVFYLSNSPLGYADAVDIPALGTAEHDLLLDQYSVYNPEIDFILKLPQKEKQQAFFFTSLNWIRENPGKFIAIKLTNLRNFFTPGVVFGHHDTRVAWLMFIVCLPFHLLFYGGLILALRTSPLKNHLWFIAFYLSMIGFLIVFLYTARFRAYSIEVYYLLYTGMFAYAMATKYFNPLIARKA